MSDCTAWYRDTGKGLDFNHMSMGWDPEAKVPPAFTTEQKKSWAKNVWVAKRATLENGVLRES